MNTHMQFIKRQVLKMGPVSLLGGTFLHRHPGLERKKDIDSDHVIVDLEDLKTARFDLSMMITYIEVLEKQVEDLKKEKF